jgi:hypothetical protein
MKISRNRESGSRALLVAGAGLLAAIVTAACGQGPEGQSTATGTEDLSLPGLPDAGLPLLRPFPLPSFDGGLFLPPLPTGLPTPPALPSGFPALPVLPGFDGGLFLPPVPTGLPPLPSGLPTPPSLPTGLPMPPALPSGFPAPPSLPTALPTLPSGLPTPPPLPTGLPLPPFLDADGGLL